MKRQLCLYGVKMFIYEHNVVEVILGFWICLNNVKLTLTNFVLYNIKMLLFGSRCLNIPLQIYSVTD